MDVSIDRAPGLIYRNICVGLDWDNISRNVATKLEEAGQERFAGISH